MRSRYARTAARFLITSPDTVAPLYDSHLSRVLVRFSLKIYCRETRECAPSFVKTSNFIRLLVCRIAPLFIFFELVRAEWKRKLDRWQNIRAINRWSFPILVFRTCHFSSRFFVTLLASFDPVRAKTRRFFSRYSSTVKRTACLDVVSPVPSWFSLFSQDLFAPRKKQVRAKPVRLTERQEKPCRKPGVRFSPWNEIIARREWRGV